MRRIILITGCSSGLGQALAHAALEQSEEFQVIATARKLSAVQELQHRGANIYALDVTSPLNELEAFAKEIISKHERIDFLINNAGKLIGGALEETTPEENADQFQTNFFSVLNLTSAFLPYFRRQKSGCIVNIGSQAGCLSISGGGLYGSTKAAIDVISEVWNKELAPFNVSCMSVVLGAFKTQVALTVQRASKHIEGYTTSNEWLDSFKDRGGQEQGDPLKAARKIISLMQQERKPVRYTLGEDAVKLVKQHYEAKLRELEEFAEAGRGTNRDDYVADERFTSMDK